MATVSAPRPPAARGSYPAFAGVPSDQKRVKTTIPQKYKDRPADEPLATFLGVFSVGLGLWQLLAPRDLGSRTGVQSSRLLTAYGLREIATGVGILSTPRPVGWLWARVAGDAVDLATLAAAYTNGNAEQKRKALESAAAVLGVTVLDVVAACAHRHPSVS